MSVFQSLAALTAIMESVDLKITGNAESITVLLLPKPKSGADAALGTPLKFAGSPAEIEAQFAEALSKTTEARNALMAAVEEANTLIQAATKAQQEKGRAALKRANSDTPRKSANATASASKTSGGTPPEGEEGENENDEGDEGVSPVAPATRPVEAVKTPASSSMPGKTNLFE